MKSWDGLTIATLALLSDKATRVFAQYVTTVTISINGNPFCTPMSGIGTYGGSSGIPGTSGGRAGGPGISVSGIGTYGGNPTTRLSGGGTGGPVSEVSESASGSLTGSASSTGSTTISDGGAGGPVSESASGSLNGSASSTGSATISRRDHISLFWILLLGVLTCFTAPPPFLP